MMDYQTLEFSQLIQAPAAQVYQAFGNANALESWFADFAEVDVQLGGRFYAWWNAGYYASGLFTKVVENKHLAFRWLGLAEPAASQVDIFFAEKDAQTLVTVQHSEIGSGEVWAAATKQIDQGWQAALANLQAIIETGLDKRIFDRPLLGIYPGAIIDQPQAEELGLPVAQGIRLIGVVPGLKAEAAGLEKDDVLFSLNEREIKNYQDFAPAIGQCKAGDTVAVIYYRGSEKHTVEMELSRRPSPEIPASAADLAANLAELYETVAAERDALFEGASEAEAEARPAPKEWSAKETLVHLLYTERWLHLAISCIVSGQRVGGFVNQLELIAAMANSYSLAGLLAELRASEKVTVASLAALPADFVADKRQFVGLVNGFGQGFAQHTRTHFDQITAAIHAARA